MSESPANDAVTLPIIPGGPVKKTTGPQTVFLTYGTPIVQKTLPVAYDTYRKIRRHPTVALARALAIAPVVAAEWTYTLADDGTDDMLRFVQREMKRLRSKLITGALRGCTDFGWQAFEKEWGLDRHGMQTIRRVKPLLHDLTHILIDLASGWPVGVWQPNRGLAAEVVLTMQECALYSMRVEGTNWYGESALETIRATFDDWHECNDGNRRFDKKIAGSHWVVHYPQGTSYVDGVEVDNSVIAQQILAALESSGGLVVPASVKTVVTNLNADTGGKAWTIQLLESDSTQQGGFASRLAYLDKLLVRGLISPERAVLESQFGTKADATAHADIALQHRELEHRELTEITQEQVVDQLLANNWGPDAEGLVTLEPVPLADDQRAWLRDVYKLILSNPSGFVSELSTIDTDALKDACDVPKSKEVAAGGQQEGEEAVGDVAAEEFPPAPAETPGQRQLAHTITKLYRGALNGAAHAR